MERRATILEAASRLLLHYGPAKTTVADIAREAHVGVGSVYLEFKSKDEILAALSGQRFGQVLTAMQAAVRGDDEASARLRAVLRARLQAFLALADDGAHGPELLRCYCPAVEAAWRAFSAAEGDLLAGIVADGVAAGDLRGEPTDTAGLILQACATLSPPLLCARRTPDVVERAERLYDLLLDGLRTR